MMVKTEKAKKCTALVISLLLVALSVCSCAHKVQMRDGAYVDSQTGIAYYYLGLNWVSGALGSHYATIKQGTDKDNQLKIEWYTIEEQSPDVWLATSDGDIFTSDVSYLDMTLQIFAPVSLSVVKKTEKKTTTLETITDEESIGIVISTAGNQDNRIELYEDTAVEYSTYDLYFSRADLKGLYYRLRYVLFDTPVECYSFSQDAVITASAFLYDMENHTYYIIPSDPIYALVMG